MRTYLPCSLALLAALVACDPAVSNTPLCHLDDDCTGNADLRYCVAGTCQACDGRPGSCPTEAPACDPDALECGGCVDDGPCAAFPGREHCSADGTCVQCVESSQCDGLTPVCNQDSQSCEPCISNDQCASGVCTAEGSCLDTAAILYVTPTGSAASTCTEVTPCNLGHAIGLAALGRDTVLLADGAYDANLAFNGQRSLVLIGGGGAILTSSADQPVLNVFAHAAVTLRGIVLSSSHVGVTCSDGSAVTVEDSVVNVGTTLDFIDGDACTMTIRRSTFNATLASNAKAIRGQNGSAIVIDRSSFFGFSRTAFIDQRLTVTNSVFSSPNTTASNQFQFAGATFSNALFAYNTFVDATLACPISGADNVVTSNVFFRTGNGGALLVAHGPCEPTNNLIQPPPLAPTGTGNVTGDPLLVDVANGDFRPGAGSPAIDAGLDRVDVVIDHDGAPRPTGVRSDIGAFEVQ